MCCCGKPTVNGQPGHSWDGKTFSTRPVAPPSLGEHETLIFDEPGRCGGIDAHSHHFRLVKGLGGNLYLLVRHGGGDERIAMGITLRLALGALTAADTNDRYWFLHSLYSVHRNATREASGASEARWRQAAADKRIRTRKLPARGVVKVWIEEARA
jgi:hypothetical protein